MLELAERFGRVAMLGQLG